MAKKKKSELKAKRDFMRKSGSEGILSRGKKATARKPKPKASATKPAKSDMTRLTEKFKRVMGRSPSRGRR